MILFRFCFMSVIFTFDDGGSQENRYLREINIFREFINIIPPYPTKKENVLRKSIDKMKDNVFKLTKERSRRYFTQTISDADYADDIVLLANTPTQPKTLLHCQKRATAGIDLHVNADKTEYMCSNQRRNISTRNGSCNLLSFLIRCGTRPYERGTQ